MLKPVACDVAVIGAGTAGLAAYRAAKAAGAKVVLVEAGPGGTTCARCGCMPSKLLLAAARRAEEIGNAKPFGIRAGKVEIDGRAVMARVRRERDHFVRATLKDVAAIPAGEKLEGRARFAGPETLTVDTHTILTARSIVIATGARPMVPDALAAACGDRLLTHETVFELDALPLTLAVIGAGPLGLELALAFSRLGVRVTLFDEGRDLGAVKDPQVGKVVRDVLSRALTLELGVEVEAKRNTAGDVQLNWRDGQGDSRRGAFAYVLSAAGRAPVVEGLDLNLAGLELDDRGVPVFDARTLRCGASSIFIAGDANDDRPVLHEASLQGELAGRNAARSPRLENRTPMPQLALVYSDPDIAQVGQGFDPEAARDWLIGCSDSVGRARIENAEPGLLRVYADKTGLLLGGQLFGPDVEHLAHLLAWAVQLKLKAEEVLELPFYHPTVEEGLRTALRDIVAQRR